MNHGSCHCGGVQFSVAIDKREALECNCSVCRKKGFLHLIVTREKFILLQGEELLTTYSFNTHVAQHRFCRICGCHPFYTPRSHPNGVSVNLRCLDDVSPDEFVIVSFDGQRWEENIAQIAGEGASANAARRTTNG